MVLDGHAGPRRVSEGSGDGAGEGWGGLLGLCVGAGRGRAPALSLAWRGAGGRRGPSACGACLNYVRPRHRASLCVTRRRGGGLEGSESRSDRIGYSCLPEVYHAGGGGGARVLSVALHTGNSARTSWHAGRAAGAHPFGGWARAGSAARACMPDQYVSRGGSLLGLAACTARGRASAGGGRVGRSGRCTGGFFGRGHGHGRGFRSIGSSAAAADVTHHRARGRWRAEAGARH